MVRPVRFFFLSPAASAVSGRGGLGLFREAEIVYTYLDGEAVRVERSTDPGLDLTWLNATRGITQAVALTYPLPPGQAEWVQGNLSAGRLRAPGARTVRQLEVAARRQLANLGRPTRYLPEVIEIKSVRRDLPSERELEAVAAAVAGRNLFLHEVSAALRAAGDVVHHPLPDCLALLRIRGVLEVRPAVRRDVMGLASCGRCGSRFVPLRLPCPFCGDSQCAVCPSCAALGEARGCRSVYSGQSAKAVPEASDGDFLAGSRRVLTVAQSAAVSQLLEMVEDAASSGHCLVRAACGAGKTEVVLAAVERALALGQRVVIAAPRREVIRELEIRLGETSKRPAIAVAIGGDAGRFIQAPLTLATIQQLFRFRAAFDLAVIDEGDAFPLRGDPLLNGAVRRAVGPSGKVVWLSATPREDLLALAGGRVIDLPARPHGYPLPIPEVVVANLQQGLPTKCGEFLKETCGAASSRVLVFVPTVAQAEPTSVRVARLLDELRCVEGAVCGFSHARDSAREHKIDQFRQGRIRVLVTTSILERGVTIPHLHVIIHQADHPVFDWAALVQMAGRAGRSPAYPLDRVMFLAGTVTPEIQRAVRHIRQLNDKARAMGFLKGGW